MNKKIIIIIKVLNNLILDKIDKYNLNHKILQNKLFKLFDITIVIIIYLLKYK